MRSIECKIIQPMNRMDLRVKSEPLDDPQTEADSLVWEWLEWVSESTDNCMGLAACQIGFNVRAGYIHVEGREPLRLRNPEIVDASKQRKVFKDEGCMSFPGQFTDTERHIWVKVKDDINGTKIYDKIEGVCVQHEIDHMNGVLLFDRKAHSQYIRGTARIGRNDPCPCDSGKKYKKCCGG